MVEMRANGTAISGFCCGNRDKAVKEMAAALVAAISSRADWDPDVALTFVHEYAKYIIKEGKRHEKV